MKIIQSIGLGLFVIALLIFTAMLGLGTVELTESNITVEDKYHKAEILKVAKEEGLLDKAV